MSGLAKQIANLQKQNDGIHKSLVAKGIEFTRVVIEPDDSEEVQVQKLSTENLELKKLSTANKPPPAPKEEKPKVVQQSQPKKEKDDEDDEEESFEDKKKKFAPIANMEGLKISFFAGDYDAFKTQVKTQGSEENTTPFLFYRASYKYNSDKDGVPSFNAKNLVKGLVKNFDEERKFFMNCFRCYQTQTEPSTMYEYRGLWIVNTLDSLKEVVGDVVDDFTLVQVVDAVELDTFLTEMQKLPVNENDELPDGCIVESYVH